MNSNFPTWYREVDLDPTEDMLKKRWAAIDALVKEAQFPLIEEAIRFFLSQGKAGNCVAQFNTAFQKADPMFIIKDNARELMVLSGAFLVRAVEVRAELAPIITLGTHCYSFYVSPTGHPLLDVVRQLDSRRLALSKSIRSYSSKLAPIKTLNLKPHIDGLQGLGAEATPAKIVEFEVKALTLIQNAWANLRQSWLESITDPMAVLAEEAELLWNLECAFIDYHGASLNKLKTSDIILPLAAQLAAATHFVPGPLSMPAMITSLIAKSIDEGGKASNLVTAITSAEGGWRLQNTEAIHSRLCPLPAMVAKSRDSESSPALKEMLGGLCDGDVLEIEVAPNILCVQYYNELLLSRLITPLKA